MKPSPVNPFYKKKFFLDLKGFPLETEKKLSTDLKLLGGKETVFSKEIDFIVSNKVPLHSKQWTPATPKTNSPCPSPQFLSDSSMDWLGSPEYNFSPSAEKKSCVKSQSRGLVLLQKAQQKRLGGTTDIFEVCRQFGIKTYPVEKVLLCVKKLKNIYCKKRSDEQVKLNEKKASKSNEVQKIKAPFIKIEDINRRYKTRHRVLSSWADIIDPVLSNSVKELHKNFKKSGTIEYESLFRSVFREISTNIVRKEPSNKKFLVPPTPSCTKSYTKHSNALHPSTTATDVRKKPQEATCTEKKQKCKKKKRKNYCEICAAYYTNLEEHMKSEYHLKFMTETSNFSAVEKILADIPKFTDVFTCLQATNVNLESKNAWTGFPILFSENTSVSKQKTESKSHKEDPLNLFSSNSRDFPTELYSVEDSYISASCSTASTGFPFLENKLEEEEIKLTSFKGVYPNEKENTDTLNTTGFQSNTSININESDIYLNTLTNNSFLADESVGNYDIYSQFSGPAPPASVFTTSTSVSFVSTVAVLDNMLLKDKKCEQASVKSKVQIKEILSSMTETFQNDLFSANNAFKHVTKTKKRRSDDEVEFSNAAKYFKNDASKRISSLSPIITNDILIDSGVCSQSFSNACPDGSISPNMDWDQTFLNSMHSAENYSKDVTVVENTVAELPIPYQNCLSIIIPKDEITSDLKSPPQLDDYSPHELKNFSNELQAEMPLLTIASDNTVNNLEFYSFQHNTSEEKAMPIEVGQNVLMTDNTMVDYNLVENDSCDHYFKPPNETEVRHFNHDILFNDNSNELKVADNCPVDGDSHVADVQLENSQETVLERNCNFQMTSNTSLKHYLTNAISKFCPGYSNLVADSSDDVLIKDDKQKSNKSEITYECKTKYQPITNKSNSRLSYISKEFFKKWFSISSQAGYPCYDLQDVANVILIKNNKISYCRLIIIFDLNRQRYDADFRFIVDPRNCVVSFMLETYKMPITASRLIEELEKFVQGCPKDISEYLSMLIRKIEHQMRLWKMSLKQQSSHCNVSNQVGLYYNPVLKCQDAHCKLSGYTRCNKPSCIRDFKVMAEPIDLTVTSTQHPAIIVKDADEETPSCHSVNMKKDCSECTSPVCNSVSSVNSCLSTNKSIQCSPVMSDGVQLHDNDSCSEANFENSHSLGDEVDESGTEYSLVDEDLCLNDIDEESFNGSEESSNDSCSDESKESSELIGQIPTKINDLYSEEF